MTLDLTTTLGLTNRALRITGPAVDEEMSRWQATAAAIPDPFLREQALASQRDKRFHAVGGSVYALLAPAGRQRAFVRLVVALQTISDYLDNLCDRGECQDLQAYRWLHQAMLDAVNPAAPPRDYYRYYPHQEDSGYLESLVTTCQEEVASLPGATRVQEQVQHLLLLYTDLQVYKHGPVAGRASRLMAWFQGHRHRWPNLYWWEFAAAAGSTLGVFALLAAAARPDPSPRVIERLYSGYFPWIGAWHILLDYLIDLEEDFLAGDLNLVSYYGDPARRQERLLALSRRCLAEADALPDAPFHRWVVQGLPALYLSDPKVKRLGLGPLARRLLTAGGPTRWLLYAGCRLQRHPLARAFFPAI